MREKLNTLPLAQLREIAKANGLKGISGLKKAELIDRLMVMAEEQKRSEEAAAQDASRKAAREAAQRAVAQETAQQVGAQESAQISVTKENAQREASQKTATRAVRGNGKRAAAQETTREAAAALQKASKEDSDESLETMKTSSEAGRSSTAKSNSLREKTVPRGRRNTEDSAAATSRGKKRPEGYSGKTAGYSIRKTKDPNASDIMAHESSLRSMADNAARNMSVPAGIATLGEQEYDVLPDKILIAESGVRTDTGTRSEFGGKVNTGSGAEPGGRGNTGSGAEPGGRGNTGSGTESGSRGNTGSGAEPGGRGNTGSGAEPGGRGNTGSGAEPGGRGNTGSGIETGVRANIGSRSEIGSRQEIGTRTDNGIRTDFVARTETGNRVETGIRTDNGVRVESITGADAELVGRDREDDRLDSGIIADGILEIMADGYGFIRSANYLPGDNDVYVSPSQIKKFGLRTGDILTGRVRIRTQNEKFGALLRLDRVNGVLPSEIQKRKSFEDLTPIFPNERLRLEQLGTRNVAMRVFDLISPIGKGQRGMIVSPPKAGKTTLLKGVAHSIQKNNPEVHILILLIDERPEEVTDIKEDIQGNNVEVIYSTFDELPEHHKRVSEMVIERAKRLVEMGRDVVILLDSITRLARAYNLLVPPSGRTLSGGLDPAALYMPKRFFGAARNIREGGSLTILATALVDTGSKMDDVVYEEFKGTGNMELILDRKLQEKRVFPAIDIAKSGTRRDDLLLNNAEQEAVYVIHKATGGLRADESTEKILDLFIRTRNNAEFCERIRVNKYL